MKRVLIIGGSGFIGLNIANELLKKIIKSQFLIKKTKKFEQKNIYNYFKFKK